MDESVRADVSGVIPPQESDHSILLVAKGGSIVFGAALFGYGSQLLIGIVLTRLLGAEQYGEYKVAVIAGEMAAGFALLGLNCAMIRFISLFASRRDSAGVWGTIQVGIGLTLLTSLLIGGGLFALASPIAQYLFHEPQLAPLLRLAGLIVPFSSITAILAESTMGFGKMQFQAGSRSIAQPVTRLALLLLFSLFGLTAAKALTAYTAGLVVSSLLLLYFLDRLFTLRRPVRTARRETGRLLRFSLPAYLSTMISTFGPSLQTILLGSLNTMATVGIFAVANQVSTASTLFNASIGTASSPIVSRLHGQGDTKQMRHFYQTTAKWMFMANLPMFLLVLFLSTPILTIFGKEFVAGSAALTLLALANLVIAAAGVSDGVLAMTGNTPLKLVNSAVQAALSIGLCFLFIPRWGALGAAMAVLVCSIVIHLLLVSEMFVLFRMLPYSFGFLKPAAAGVVALVVGWLVQHFLHTETSLGLAALQALVLLVAYADMILILGLSQEDRAVIAQIRARLTATFSRR